MLDTLVRLGPVAIVSCLLASEGLAQLLWVDPQEADGWRVEGRIVDGPGYGRLPVKAQGEVRAAVWNLGRHSAGLRVRFWTNAAEIHLAYELVSERLEMAHMPATGVSGFDLYRRTKEAGELWVAATKPSAPAATVRLVGGMVCEERVPALYTLYLPLYNGVKSLRIGVPEGCSLDPAVADELSPIVVYGTSIAQGGCASRPGLAWTNVLGRNLDWPVVNLGFSGNGKMELPVMDLILEQEAAVYVIDCAPNLSDDELRVRIGPLLDRIREKRPETPVLIVGAAPRDNQRWLAGKEPAKNQILSEETSRRASAGKGRGHYLHYLAGSELLGDDGEATVDGVHPNDIGMMRIAAAYETALRPILGLERAEIIEGVPVVSQLREIPGYNFMQRHQEVLQRHRELKPEVLWIGDSIIHFFSGSPTGRFDVAPEAWHGLFEDRAVTNLGFGWDRTENVMWRLQRGELDRISPQLILLSIGTNDLSIGRTAEQVVDSILALVEEIQLRQPEANMVVSGILPRRGYEDERLGVNSLLDAASDARSYSYVDLSEAFPRAKSADGKMIIPGMPDQLHPDAEGYRRMAGRLRARLDELE